MRALAFVCFSAALALPSTGCAGFLFGGGHKDPLHEAARGEREMCGGDPIDPRIYGPDVVLRVEPEEFWVQSGRSDRAVRLAGAKLHLRPLPGVTAELLARGLKCREARVVLGREPAAPNEPYALPDSWVKIDVSSGDGSFVVGLEAEDIDHAKVVLARASAFAKR